MFRRAQSKFYFQFWATLFFSTTTAAFPVVMGPLNASSFIGNFQRLSWVLNWMELNWVIGALKSDYPIASTDSISDSKPMAPYQTLQAELCSLNVMTRLQAWKPSKRTLRTSKSIVASNLKGIWVPVCQHLRLDSF